MDRWIAQAQRSVTVWLTVVAWLSVFLSPSAYFVLLAFWGGLNLPAPPVGVVVSLFVLIPFVALLVCGSLVWRKLAVGWRVGALGLTVLGMTLQVAVLLVVIRASLVAMISYGQ